MMSAWSKFRSALRAFRVARGGNVALTFVFATLPIIAGVGFAVDYSRANSVKAALQAALDSTALMISKEAASDSSSQLQTNAQNYFNALFTRAGISNVTINVSYTTSGGSQVVVNGGAQVPTSFLGIIGYNSVTVNGSSTVKWGMSRLRVALVLDNTGSMADNGKITALKTATNNLLTQLKNAANSNGDVYVSIVPFVKDVNIDPSNWNSDYIYWGTQAQDSSLSDNNSWDANNGSCSASGWGTNSNRSACLAAGSCSIWGYNSASSCAAAGTCSISGYNSQSTCTAAGTCSISNKTNQSSCTSAGVCSNPGVSGQSNCTSTKACSNSNYTSSWSCTSHGYTWNYGTWKAGVWSLGTWSSGVWSAVWTPDNHSTWNGCVMDRGFSTTPDTTNNYDTNVVQPDVTKNASLYAAEQYSSCPQPIMGLNYNWSSMTTEVNNMQPAGNTNQAIGLQLGWMSLVGGGPFTAPAMDPNFTYTQVIILLTDGLNTQDRWYTSQNSIDARQQLTCNNIKNSGIVLYTIQVNTGGDPTSTLLQNCASSSDKFFLLTSANQIVTTFNTIGTNLSNLYVAK